ncbi:hypothetical protein B296_00030947 [Ensete ventricosum]|uniref:Uncharacterized protein n=1 Tax=Ensete ventricosum TaxID=4639 RepID=A0A426XQE4_ENSVE|nr:hypothetical protein B296_00030947 [Ensete ventricosum]
MCSSEGLLPPLQRSIPLACTAAKGSLPPLLPSPPSSPAKPQMPLTLSPVIPVSSGCQSSLPHAVGRCLLLPCRCILRLFPPSAAAPSCRHPSRSNQRQMLPPSAPSVVPATSSRCCILLMPLLSSASTAQAVVAAAVLFLCQPRCCLPCLCHQSYEQDRLGRASPTVSPPLHRCHRRAPPLCLIVTGSDLRPTVPSRPSSALMLLSQPLLVDCLTAAPSSSPTIFYSNSEKKRNESNKEKKMKGINAASCSPHFQSPNEILLSATAARQHRRLLPQQSTPTLSILHYCPMIAYAPFFLLCVPRVEPPHSHACTLILSQAYMAAEVNYCQTFTVVDNIAVSFLQIHWHLFKIYVLHRSLILWGHDSLMIV